jgi:hypothetical protein
VPKRTILFRISLRHSSTCRRYYGRKGCSNKRMASSSRSKGHTVVGLEKKKGSTKRRVARAKSAMKDVPYLEAHHYDLLDIIVAEKKAGKPIPYDVSTVFSMHICSQIFAHHWPEDTLSKIRSIMAAEEDPCSLSCAIKLSSLITSVVTKNKSKRDMDMLAGDEYYIGTLGDVFGYHPNSIEFTEFIGWAYVRVLAATSKNDSATVEARSCRIFQAYVDLMQRYNMDSNLECIKEEMHAFEIVAKTEGVDLDKLNIAFMRPRTADILGAEGRLASHRHTGGLLQTE